MLLPSKGTCVGSSQGLFLPWYIQHTLEGVWVGGSQFAAPRPTQLGFGLLCCCLPAHLCFPAFVVSLCLKQSSGQEHRPGTTCSSAQTLRDSHPAFSETLCCMAPQSLSCHWPLILQFSDFQLGREMTVSLGGRNLPFLLESSISLELDLRWGWAAHTIHIFLYFCSNLPNSNYSFTSVNSLLPAAPPPPSIFWFFI